MATYYKKIRGKNYDGKLINKADRSVKGRGDGRISLNDAKALLKTVKDSANYTDIEKATMRHIRDNYDFTPEADRWFRTQVRTWAATKAPGRAAAKKSVPKPAARKRPSVKKAAAKKPSRRRAAPPVRRKQSFEQEYIAPPSELIDREPVSSRKTRSKAPVIILLLLIAIIAGLLLCPKTREWIHSKIGQATPVTEDTAVKPPEQPAPPPAETEAVQPEKKAAPPVEEKPITPPEEEGSYYIVQAHEGLVAIAEKELGDYRKWVDIYRANITTIPRSLQLYTGQKLKMPEGAKVKK